jgi:hypothetical protein
MMLAAVWVMWYGTCYGPVSDRALSYPGVSVVRQCPDGAEVVRGVPPDVRLVLAIHAERIGVPGAGWLTPNQRMLPRDGVARILCLVEPLSGRVGRCLLASEAPTIDPVSWAVAYFPCVSPPPERPQVRRSPEGEPLWLTSDRGHTVYVRPLWTACYLGCWREHLRVCGWYWRGGLSAVERALQRGASLPGEEP